MDKIILQIVLKDSNYKLNQFTLEEQDKLLQNLFIKESKSGTSYFVKCFKRNKEIKLTPEEVIRQLFIIKLTDHYNYPLDRIEVEYPINFGREKNGLILW